MQKSEENYIEHEVKIRILAASAERIEKRFERLENKMDSHFKWTMIAIVGLMVTNISFLITLIITLNFSS
jgi:hypoxanthine-guanine phosphoribosyltransferase